MIMISAGLFPLSALILIVNSYCVKRESSFIQTVEILVEPLTVIEYIRLML